MYLGSAAVDRWDSIVYPTAEYWGVPPEWDKAVIEVESSGNPDAYNPTDPGGARGLMQIIGPTARAYGVSDLESLFSPAVNIGVGTELLSDLRQSYGDDFRRVYSAYNSGSPDRWLTSSQVAANVGRAMDALSEYAGPYSGVEVSPAEIPVQEAAAPSWAILAAGIGLLFAGSKRKRRRR